MAKKQVKYLINHKLVPINKITQKMVKEEIARLKEVIKQYTWLLNNIEMPKK